MSTRCIPGDLAIIAYDIPSCTPNIGRFVEVHGPAGISLVGQITWLIRPVTLEPYMINDLAGAFDRFMALDDDHIEHPDEWMIPIRVVGERDVVETGEGVAA